VTNAAARWSRWSRIRHGVRRGIRPIV
jgi:hypothetical protein